MIESAAAQTLTEQLRQVEERLGRLLISGWRQAHAEAADLRQDADALAEAGLPALAARIVAVAEAGDTGQALQAIALAMSACRLLRTRLPSQTVPDGWLPLTPTRKSQSHRTEALVPISRLLLDGREVWACTRTNRNQMLLVEPPLPPDEPAPAPANTDSPKGVFGRLRQRIGLSPAGEPREPSNFLRHRLAGTLHWQAQYPLGTQGDVGYWTLEDPAWVTDHDEQNSLLPFQRLLAANTLQDGTPLFWSSGGFRVHALQRDDAASYVWVDPSAAEAFAMAPTEKVWSIVWLEGAAVVPVALVTPAGKVSPPRLTHLIAGAPEETLIAMGEAAWPPISP
jgi:hypothetical protein